MWRGLAGICLVVFSAAATAVPQPVNVAGSLQFELGLAPFSGLQFAVDLTAPEPGGAGSFVEGDSAWGFHDLAAVLSIDGTTRDDRLQQIGWFDYSGSYAGVDLRFSDVFDAGDWLQIVLYTHTPLFSGPVSAPSLLVLARSGLTGFVGYQSPDGDYTDGSVYAGHYMAGVVPESPVALLLLLGLPVLSSVARRRPTPGCATP